MAKSTQRRIAGSSQTRTRSPDKRQVRSHHATRQVYREQDEIAARLMAEDEAVELWDPEALLEEDESLEEQGLDSEVDLGDEDEVPLDEAAPEANLDHFTKHTLIIVHDGRAFAQAPDWDLGRPPSGQMEERSLRYVMLGRLANWLNAERSEFLRSPVSAPKPDPFFNFSISSTNLNGPIPVMEEGLFEVTSCHELGDFSTFHRHLRHTALKWPDYFLPVSELLSHRSRIAWVAAAVLDLKGARTINLELLRGEIAVPQGKDSDAARAVLRRIPAGNPRKAAPRDYTIAACLKAKVAWSKVLELYSTHIFQT